MLQQPPPVLACQKGLVAVLPATSSLCVEMTLLGVHNPAKYGGALSNIHVCLLALTGSLPDIE